MARRIITGRLPERLLRRPLLLACLLGLTLLLGHQLVMATGQHARDMNMGMSPGHSLLAPVAAVLAAPIDSLDIRTTSGGEHPFIGWEGCFAQNGTLPVPLLLLSIGSEPLWWALPLSRPSRGRSGARRFLPLPSLSPMRRRALLQVFLN